MNLNGESIFSTKITSYQRRDLWKTSYYIIGLIICEGNVKKAADFLGVSEKTLYEAKKLKKEIQDIIEVGFEMSWRSDWTVEKMKQVKGGLYKGFEIMDTEEGTVKWLCEQQIKSTIDKAYFQHESYEEQIKIINRIRDRYLTGSYEEI